MSWAKRRCARPFTNWAGYAAISAAQFLLRLNLKGTGDGYLLAPPIAFGGGNTLFGSGEDQTRADFSNHQYFLPQASQGRPDVANNYQISEGIEWMPDGEPDSNLSLVIELHRAISWVSDLDIAAAAPVPATGFQGITARLMPAAGEVGTFALLHARLIGSVTSKRSPNT